MILTPEGNLPEFHASVARYLESNPMMTVAQVAAHFKIRELTVRRIRKHVGIAGHVSRPQV